MAYEQYESTVCSLNINDGMCARGPCRDCGWSYEEIARRKRLPLVPLRNGLMGKKVGKYPRKPVEVLEEED